MKKLLAFIVSISVLALSTSALAANDLSIKHHNGNTASAVTTQIKLATTTTTTKSKTTTKGTPSTPKSSY